MEPTLLGTIVEDNIERTRYRDKKLLSLIVRMPAALTVGRNVIQIKHTLNFKRHRAHAFNDTEVTPRIRYPCNINNPWLIHSIVKCV